MEFSSKTELLPFMFKWILLYANYTCYFIHMYFIYIDYLRYGGTITNQIKRLGASCDWNREHFTLDEQLSRKAFFYLIEI